MQPFRHIRTDSDEIDAAYVFGLSPQQSSSQLQGIFGFEYDPVEQNSFGQALYTGQYQYPRHQYMYDQAVYQPVAQPHVYQQPEQWAAQVHHNQQSRAQLAHQPRTGLEFPESRIPIGHQVDAIGGLQETSLLSRRTGQEHVSTQPADGSTPTNPIVLDGLADGPKTTATETTPSPKRNYRDVTAEVYSSPEPDEGDMVLSARSYLLAMRQYPEKFSLIFKLRAYRWFVNKDDHNDIWCRRVNDEVEYRGWQLSSMLSTLQKESDAEKEKQRAEGKKRVEETKKRDKQREEERRKNKERRAEAKRERQEEEKKKKEEEKLRRKKERERKKGEKTRKRRMEREADRLAPVPKRRRVMNPTFNSQSPPAPATMEESEGGDDEALAASCEAMMEDDGAEQEGYGDQNALVVSTESTMEDEETKEPQEEQEFVNSEDEWSEEE